MERRVLISVDPRETRMAVFEGAELVQYRVERDTVEVGSIYKGRVDRVLPGMDSAFVDIGLERNAFMHVSDFMGGEIIDDDDDNDQPSAPEPKADRGGRPRRPGRHEPLPPITDLVHEGDEVLVQVARGPVGGKGARATTHVSLPGRYVVLLPVGSSHVGVSRRIEDDGRRNFLKQAATQARPRGQGLIVRTEAAGCDADDIRTDVEALRKTWRRIRDSYRKKRAPALLHEEASLVERMVRDMYSTDTREILVDDEREYRRALAALKAISGEAAKRCKLHHGTTPLFEAHGVEAQLERALRRRVVLPSGGNLTIDETEAMCTIDVNTGRFVGSVNQADTILTTNLESAREIARQLRLRDIGGIIILDFIDMKPEDHKRQVMAVLEEGLSGDKARSRIIHISPLGLVEMTRKRSGQSLLQSMCRGCTHCDGRGRVLSAETLAVRAEREARWAARTAGAEALVIVAPLEVAWELIGDEGRTVRKLEEEVGISLYVRADPNLERTAFDIRHGSKAGIEADYHPFRKGQMFHCRPRKARLGDRASVLMAEVDGYLILLAGNGALRNARRTVELTDVHRSYARGRIVE